MKSVLLSLAFSTFSTFAATGPKVLLYSEFQSGGSDSAYVGVFDDGSILAWGGDVNNPGTSAKVLGKVSSAVVRGLKARVEAVPQNLKLVDPNPENPSCHNTATSAYAVRKADGAIVKISTTVGCHTSVPSDDLSDTDLLLREIAAFEDLQTLSQN